MYMGLNILHSQSAVIIYFIAKFSVPILYKLINLPLIIMMHSVILLLCYSETILYFSLIEAAISCQSNY